MAQESGAAATADGKPRRPSESKPREADPPVQTLTIDLPSAEFSRIRTATYVKSSVKLEDCPPDELPEFAVIGRSNVGKSSLINMLTETAGLARVGKRRNVGDTPGRCGSFSIP